MLQAADFLFHAAAICGPERLDRRTSSRPCEPCSRDPFLQKVQGLEAGRRLGAAWGGLLGEDPLSGVHELARGQSLDLPGGGMAAVDASGGMTVAPGRSTRRPGLCCGQAPRGLRLADGRIRLPGGREVPFGNRGALVRLPDGTQVAVGRDGDGPGARAVRWVVAGPGEDVPTHPPGATNVFQLDPSGRLRLVGTK